ncbi:MAG: rplY [Candidatus Saccharibacteria bacterium]|nr:rplY [Candidatus Saccharibacteria bacterium]
MTQDTISLNLEPRTISGKAVKHLRRDGHVPAVIHDHGKDSLNVQASYTDMLKVWQLAGKHHPVNIKTDGKSMTALIKSATFDPQKHMLTHVVFNAVNANQTVEAEIPIHPKYDEGNEASPAERTGYIVLSQLETVAVEATPSHLPDMLYYDAEKLVNIGDHATVADLVVPAGVEVKTDAGHAIATVFEPSALAAANDAAGGDAEPEDAEEVESEHESGTVEGDQAEENRPGGKKEFEAKGE